MPGFTEQAQAGTAGLLFDRAGFKTSFQLYDTIPNQSEGSDAYVPSGAPVLAAMVKDSEPRRRAGAGDSGSRPVRAKSRVYHVEVPAFAASGGLTDDWRPTIDGIEERLESAILCDDDTFYVARVSTGAA